MMVYWFTMHPRMTQEKSNIKFMRNNNSNNMAVVIREIGASDDNSSSSEMESTGASEEQPPMLSPYTLRLFFTYMCLIAILHFIKLSLELTLGFSVDASLMA